jgi:hypothetical protein
VRALALLLLLIPLAAACHSSDDERVAVFFRQRLGADGPNGQVVPVLEPVTRTSRAHMDPAWQALLELRQGPTPSERALGFEPTLDLESRPLSVRIERDLAIVELAAPTDIYGSAAIVYSLTELDGIERVRLVVDGKPCCFWRTDGGVFAFATRAQYRHWTGEPCELRTTDPHARCRRDDA